MAARNSLLAWLARRALASLSTSAAWLRASRRMLPRNRVTKATTDRLSSVSSPSTMLRVVRQGAKACASEVPLSTTSGYLPTWLKPKMRATSSEDCDRTAPSRCACRAWARVGLMCMPTSVLAPPSTRTRTTPSSPTSAAAPSLPSCTPVYTSVKWLWLSDTTTTPSVLPSGAMSLRESWMVRTPDTLPSSVLLMNRPLCSMPGGGAAASTGSRCTRMWSRSIRFTFLLREPLGSRLLLRKRPSASTKDSCVRMCGTMPVSLAMLISVSPLSLPSSMLACTRHMA